MIIYSRFSAYQYGFSQIKSALVNNLVDRVKWDLKKVSRKSRSVLSNLEGSQKHKKAVILCNGPSLLHTDFSLLENTFTFGLNRINLMFEQNHFRPDIILAFDSLLNMQNIEFFREDRSILKILTYKSYSDIKISRDDLIYSYHTAVPKAFCCYPSDGFIDRGNTTFKALQLAFSMGFEQVALVGADHNFATDKPNEIILNDGDDKLHFHKDYHLTGTKSQNPDKLMFDMNFRDARIVYEKNGRKIVNASQGGFLEEFERMDLETFIKGSNDI